MKRPATANASLWLTRISVVLALAAAWYLYFALSWTDSRAAHEPALATPASGSQAWGNRGSRVGTKPIEAIRVGDRVFARNPEIDSAERAAWSEPDWSEWLYLSLVMPRPDGTELAIELLRPETWVLERVESLLDRASEPGAPNQLADLFFPSESEPASENRVPFSPVRPYFRELALARLEYEAAGLRLTGLTIDLDLPEMGAMGTAFVLDMRPCPSFQSGEGHAVTATFSHPPSTNVLDVCFEGETQPIGVTDNHLFWSVEREQFLPIGEMQIGEHVQTLFGEKKAIEQQLPRPGPQLVYNLEVYGEHVYYVGEQGLLAHNAYPMSPAARGWNRGLRNKFNRELKAAGVTSASTRRIILNNIRDNFVDYGTVKIRRIGRERSFWRRWDGVDADELGRYGAIGPRSPDYTRNSLAVRDDWNALTNETRFRIRKGGLVIEGTTAPKINVDGTKLSGGGHQLFVPDLGDLVK